MKFCFNAAIAIYLFIFLLSALNTHAAQEKNQILERKWKIFSRLLHGKHKLQQNAVAKDLPQNLQQLMNTNVSDEIENERISQPAHLSQNSIMHANKHVLAVILNEFLTIKDILVLRKTCKVFQNLLQPNHTNMVTFCDYPYYKNVTDTTIVWDDLKYFLKQNYISAFQEIEIFNIQENEYAVLTQLPEEKIVVWNNKFSPYPQMLLDQSAPIENQFFLYKLYKLFLSKFSDNNATSQIPNKMEDAWAKITKEGNVKTGGNIENGGDSSMVQFKLKYVKQIVSTGCAFAAILGEDRRVVAWGHENWGGKIPYDIQTQLKNVKMIFSNFGTFVALLNDGNVVSWGYHTIPDEIQTQLNKNVKVIVSTDLAFCALLNDGSVIAWGHQNFGSMIPAYIQQQLQNVKMIFSTDHAFLALLNDGSILTWGHEDFGGKVPDEIYAKLIKNVKTIIPTATRFTALSKTGDIFTW